MWLPLHLAMPLRGPRPPRPSSTWRQQVKLRILALRCAPACRAACMRSERASSVIQAKQPCMVCAKRTFLAIQEMYEIVWPRGHHIPMTVSRISWTTHLQVQELQSDELPRRAHWYSMRFCVHQASLSVAPTLNAPGPMWAHVTGDTHLKDMLVSMILALFAVVREVLRITPIVPALFRRALKDFSLGGWLVPKVFSLPQPGLFPLPAWHGCQATS